MTITAPIDGTVADREITIGDRLPDPGVKLIEKLVYVKSGDGYQPTTVTLGQTVGDLVEVKTGLFATELSAQ